MTSEDIIRAWKDPDGAASATHPAGEIMLDPYGGDAAEISFGFCSFNFCTFYPCIFPPVTICVCDTLCTEVPS